MIAEDIKGFYFPHYCLHPSPSQSKKNNIRVVFECSLKFNEGLKVSSDNFSRFYINRTQELGKGHKVESGVFPKYPTGSSCVSLYIW